MVSKRAHRRRHREALSRRLGVRWTGEGRVNTLGMYPGFAREMFKACRLLKPNVTLECYADR